MLALRQTVIGDSQLVRLTGADTAGTLTLDPVLPAWLPELTLEHVAVGAHRIDLRVWRDGDHTLINTEPKRQRSKNVARDPRITVLIHSADDPWDWSEVRGTVTDTVGGQRARDHIDELSNRYVGTDYRNPIGPAGRIILEVTPTKVNTAKSIRP